MLNKFTFERLFHPLFRKLQLFIGLKIISKNVQYDMAEFSVVVDLNAKSCVDPLIDATNQSKQSTRGCTGRRRSTCNQP